MERDIQRLIEMIASSRNIVAFTGAGVSTESGIPDFRSSKGIFNMDGKGFPPEGILSKSFFDKYPDKFYEFYKERLVYRDAKPNQCHMALVELEEEGKLKTVITQNIDNLHTAAGSKNVIELHGNALQNYCDKCNKKFSLDYIYCSSAVPKCDICGGIVRPDIVLYEEMLDEDRLYKAKWSIREADMVIVIGTSLVVYPAANLIRNYEGDKLVIINMTETSLDEYAELVIHEPAGMVMAEASYGLKLGSI